MASMESMTYLIITEDQVRLVDRVNRERLHGWCGANYFLGAGVTAALWAINTYSVDKVNFWSAVALSVTLLAIAASFHRVTRRSPSGGVAAILEAEGLPPETVTVNFAGSNGEPAGQPVVMHETSMVPQ